jgi:hypothetical protein
VQKKVTSNTGDFDDPRGIYGTSKNVTFGSPIQMDQIVFAALREPVAKRTGLRKIGESKLHPSIPEAIKKLEELGFTSYLLAMPEYNLEKLKRTVNQVKEILSSFKYPYNRRIAGGHGNFRMSDYRKWLLQASKEDLARALCRLAQLNQPKVYLYWKKSGHES